MMSNVRSNVPKLLLNSRAAAEALSVSERTLWMLTKQSEVVSVRIGRLVRYDPSDLQAYIEANKHGRTASLKQEQYASCELN